MATPCLLLVAALLALPLWVASVVPAHACTCGQEGSQSAWQAANSDLIVVGLVTERSGATDGSSVPSQITWSVRVSEYVKGTGPELISVRTVLPITCDFLPTVNEQYLLFLGHSSDGALGTSVCSGNWLIKNENVSAFRAKVAELRYFLNNPSGLPPVGSRPPSRSDTHVPLIVASALAALGLIANAAYALRQRN